MGKRGLRFNPNLLEDYANLCFQLKYQENKTDILFKKNFLIHILHLKLGQNIGAFS